MKDCSLPLYNLYEYTSTFIDLLLFFYVLGLQGDVGSQNHNGSTSDDNLSTFTDLGKLNKVNGLVTDLMASCEK